MATEDEKKSKSSRQFEFCVIFSMVILGLTLAIVVIVYLVQNKPQPSKYKTSDMDAVKTPYAAVESGVTWLRQQQAGNTWPRRQSADAVLALRLGKMEQFSRENCEFRLVVKSAEFDILSGMLMDKTMLNSQWGKGLLAKYIVALNSACIDVTNFHEKNLLTILDTQYNTYNVYYNSDRRALSWYALAYCTAKKTPSNSVMNLITANSTSYVKGIEEASMIAIALTACQIHNMTNYESEIAEAQQYILARQLADGSFGNEYNTAIAVQALANTNSSKWQGEMKVKALTFLSNLIQDTNKGQYKNLGTANYIMTALSSRSFADAKMDCINVAPTTPAVQQSIQIRIRVKGGVVSPTTDVTQNVTIASGQTLYDALTKLAAENKTFSFVSSDSSFGEVLETMQGVSLNANSNQYWKIMEDSRTLSESVSYIIPKAGKTYTFEVSTN